jgi:hypothetical protein
METGTGTQTDPDLTPLFPLFPLFPYVKFPLRQPPGSGGG